MDKFKERIDAVIELIEMLAQVLAGGTNIRNEELISVLNVNLLQLLPDIVDLYQREELKEYEEEIFYWENQLERLLQALQGDDKFFLYDVLVIETKAALQELQIRLKIL